MATIIHPFLNDGVEARAYQIRSLRSALTSSSLMVMPTGFGKTAVEWMIMAEYLSFGNGKILLIAPTTGLVEQQQRMAREMINLEDENISRYTGETAPAKRPEIWNKSRIIMATSQVIRNDAQSGAIDLSEVSLLVVDEAHHATGNHAYAQVGDLYLESKPDAMVLAATASPGSNEKNILEVAQRLGIERLDVSRREEPLLEPYSVDLENIPIRVDLPDELITLIHPLQAHQNDEVKRLQRLGFLAPTQHLTSKIIDAAQKNASIAIQRRDARGYDAARRISDLRRMHLLIDLLKTQGMKSASSYLQRAEEDGRSGDRGTNRFVSLGPVHNFRIAANDLPELHPKTEKVHSLVIQQLEQKPKSKILIFTEFRDTVENLVEYLGSIEKASVDRFIGQSSRGKKKGMNQKQQLEQLRRFRSGEINVLVATSVGEEGLDVPSADLVLLYEPVPSAIRAIQRRGRTARQSDGTVKTLITRNTRDEFVHSAAKIREERMYVLLDRIQKRGRLPRRPPATNDVLKNFSVQCSEEEIIDAGEFLQLEIDRLVTELPFKPMKEISVKETTKQVSIDSQVSLNPSDRRPRNQTGLDSFYKKSEDEISAVEQRKKEASTISAAQKEIESMIPTTGQRIILDHRESSSTLAAYLRSMGFQVEFQHLDCGDIKITEEVLVERKTSRDLLNSITDGRLMKQCHKLIKNCKYPLLLIELGEVGSAVHPNAVLGAMAHITLDIGIPVMMTKNTLESAHFLSIAAKRRNDVFHELKKSSVESLDENDINSKLESAKKEIEILISDDSYQSPLLERWKLEALECKVEVVCKITGMDKDTSRFLLQHFGSIAGLLTASEKKLMETEYLTNDDCRKIIQAINLQ
ncbi:MAG: helicase-related protein [Candidatus Poseidoniaceae archaeon]|nr:helicase-related protein [Candidatus Poseidoniaceae archaeon]